jgi:hypothetical protein
MTQITSIKLGLIAICIATVPWSLAQTPRTGTSRSNQTGATTGAMAGHSGLSGNSTSAAQLGTNFRSNTSTAPNTNVGAHMGINAGAQTGTSNPTGGITGGAAGDLVAQAATRQGLHRLGQMPGLARIPRRTRTPEHTLPPPLPRLPVSILFSRNSSRCQLTAHHLTTAPSAQLSRLRGNPPRRYPRPPSPQLRLRPRRKCSDPPWAAKATRKDVRTQRRFGCRAYAELLRGHDRYM